MTAKKVAILGTGYEGVFAAWAAADCGCDVTVFHIKNTLQETEKIYYFLWLPGNRLGQIASTPIYLSRKGNEETYKSLQWAKVPLTCFLTDFPLRDGYIAGYQPIISLAKFLVSVLDNYPEDMEVHEMSKHFDIIFQTFPTQESRLKQPELLYYYVAEKFNGEENNYVIYNGSGEGIVVKECQLWDRRYLEFPKNLPMQEINRVMSLQGYEIYCMKDINPFSKPYRQTKEQSAKIQLVGKWAEWNRLRSPADVYTIVYNRLQNDI